MSGMASPKVSRRRFFKMAGIATGAVVLAGCGGEKPTSVPPPAQEPTTAPVAEPTTAPAPEATAVPTGCTIDWNPTTPSFDKYSPEVEIAVPFESGQEFAFETDTITNSPMYNRIVDQLGIRYTVAWEAPRSEYYTRLNTDLAAGTLPDAFRCKSSALSTFIDPGAVEDITELWDSLGSDLAKEKKGYPDGPIWRNVKRDGRIFGIAYFEDGYGSDSIAYIRQDWLDQLGLQAPSTLDEMTEVARAFKSAGVCEFPIAICNYLVTWDYGVDPVFGAFGVVPAGYDPGYWLKGDDGKLRYSSLEPGAKDALAVLNTWFNEELINPDFVNQDESGPNDAFMAGQVGIAFQPSGGSRWNVPDLYSAYPEAKISIIPNPAGPTGKRGRAGTPLNGNAVFFRKGVDPAKIEALIKHVNWQVEMHANFEQYQQYGEYLNGAAFFQGYEWDLDED
jgi:putative aldouronate transport system substrate-binding protein